MQATSHGLLEGDLELCLDFTDLVDWRTSNHAKDRLDSYVTLLNWSKKHGILDAGQEAALLNTPKEVSVQVLADAIKLREAIYRIFSDVAHKRKAGAKDIGILNEYLLRGLSRARVTDWEGSYGWNWSDKVSPDMMIYPIASSAANLLTSRDLTRVRECANEDEGCGSLFLDCSKSQTKKWCSMDSCGNRMKFRTYYDKHLRVKNQQTRV